MAMVPEAILEKLEPMYVHMNKHNNLCIYKICQIHFSFKLLHGSFKITFSFMNY